MRTLTCMLMLGLIAKNLVRLLKTVHEGHHLTFVVWVI